MKTLLSLLIILTLASCATGYSRIGNQMITPDGTYRIINDSISTTNGKRHVKEFNYILRPSQ